MKNKKLILIVALVVGVAALYFVIHKKSGSTGASATAGANAGKKILYWKAPMDPNYISDKPGKSPMGMDLVPVYASEAQQAGTVKINPVIVQDMGVRTAVIKKRQLKRDIRAVARVSYDEQKVADVNAKIMGWIEKLYVNYEGQKVKKGDPLFEIYSPKLVATQREYLLALDYQKKMDASGIKELDDQAASLLDAARTRLEYWDISPEQIEQLRDSGRVRKTLMIRSPATGVVVKENALEGQMTKPGKTLYRIADLSKVWVYADIYQYELPWVHAGQSAEMTLSYLPGATFKGTIDYVYPILDTRTRTVRVRLVFDNPTGELKPGMYATVHIDTAPTKEVVAVPQEAVIHSGERDVIVIAKGHGLFEPRDIEPGIQTKDYMEVLKGAKAGETVVTSAQFLIDSESQLNEAINKMLKAGKSSSSPTASAAVEPVGKTAGTGMKEKTVPAKSMSMNMPMPQESASQGKTTSMVQSDMQDIWEAYFYIRGQLVQDSIDGVAEKAGVIQKKAQAVLDANPSADLRSTAQAILSSAAGLSANDLSKVREGFEKFSDQMIRYMENSDAAAKQKGYKLFYCSMKKASWVQRSEKIGNPYLGSKMPGCGVQKDY